MNAAQRRCAEILGHALGLPEAWEDHPWDHAVAKVGRKVFVFTGGADDGEPSLTVKLVGSRDHALSVEGAAPAGYGLGRSGWVTVPVANLDVDLGADWVEESYRQVAPMRLAGQLDAGR